jgi:hypothetical protein
MSDSAQVEQMSPDVYDATLKVVQSIQLKRNRYVEYSLNPDTDGSRFDLPIIRRSVRASRYSYLFPVGVADSTRMSKLTDFFDVATMLRTDAETPERAISHRIMESTGHDSSLSVTGEEGLVHQRKSEAAARYGGVTALEAMALLCGYSEADVSVLSADEVSRAFGYVLACAVQMPWSFIQMCLAEDIDASLVVSLSGSHDESSFGRLV